MDLNCCAIVGRDNDRSPGGGPSLFRERLRGEMERGGLRVTDRCREDLGEEAERGGGIPGVFRLSTRAKVFSVLRSKGNARITKAHIPPGGHKGEATKVARAGLERGLCTDFKVRPRLLQLLDRELV